MKKVKDYPVLGLALLSFSLDVTLSRIGDGEDSRLELTYGWSALVWNGGGMIWTDLKKG